MAFIEDIAEFMDADTGFAVKAIYNGSTEVTGIFGAEPSDAFSVGASRPTFLCAVADLDADPRGKQLDFDGTIYTIREFDHDLTGTLVTMKLEAV